MFIGAPINRPMILTAEEANTLSRPVTGSTNSMFEGHTGACDAPTVPQPRADPSPYRTPGSPSTQCLPQRANAHFLLPDPTSAPVNPLLAPRLPQPGPAHASHLTHGGRAGAQRVGAPQPPGSPRTGCSFPVGVCSEGRPGVRGPAEHLTLQGLPNPGLTNPPMDQTAGGL